MVFLTGTRTTSYPLGVWQHVKSYRRITDEQWEIQLNTQFAILMEKMVAKTCKFTYGRVLCKTRKKY